MSKSKCNVYVISSRGRSKTTHRGARRLVARGLATGDPADGSVQMIETDPRFYAEAAAANAARIVQSARLAVIVARNMASGRYRNEVLGLPNFVRTGNTGERSSVGVIME